MTLTQKLADALSDLMGHLYQERDWMEGDIQDDRSSPRSEDDMRRTRENLAETEARIAAYEALIAAARKPRFALSVRHLLID